MTRRFGIRHLRNAPFLSAFLLLAAVLTPAGAAPPGVPALTSNRITAVQPFPDGLLFGTARGVFALISSDSGRMIPGLDSFVFSLVERNGVVLVGASDGPALLRQGTIRPVTPPSRWSDPAILTVAATNDFFVAGGSGGLLTITPEGVVRTPALPPGAHAVIATAANGVDLLVAFENELSLFRPRSEEWLRIDAGRAYTALVLLEDGRWFGLDRGGVLFTGRSVTGGAPERIDAGLSDDAALALALHPLLHSPASGGAEASSLLVGSMRGRLLSLPIEAGRSTFPARIILDGAEAGFPIRALAVSDKGEIVAGTDGGGGLIISATGDVRRIVSTLEPITPFAFNAVQTPDRRTIWTRIIRQKSENLLRLVAARRLPIVSALLAIGAFVLLLFLVTRRSSPEGRRIREKRRANRSPINLPSPEDLSPEIGALALRFMSITNEINELSRAAAKGRANEIAEQARRASISFEETEDKMRMHYSGLCELRRRHLDEIEDFKKRIREATEEEKSEIRAHLDVLEQSLEQAEKDERYLRYVLEE